MCQKMSLNIKTFNFFMECVTIVINMIHIGWYYRNNIETYADCYITISSYHCMSAQVLTQLAKG